MNLYICVFFNFIEPKINGFPMKNKSGHDAMRLIHMFLALFFFIYFSWTLSAQQTQQTPGQTTEKVAPGTSSGAENRPYDVIDPEFRNIGPGFGGMNAVPFWVSVVVLLLATVVLFKAKNKAVKGVASLAALAALGVISYITYWEARALGRQQGYAPVQPIWFSHKVHVTQNGIDCEYCHSDARVSRHAGIPSLSTCMNCHNVVKSGTISKEKEIAKIYEHIGFNPKTDKYDKPGKPIEWVKVHNLPDHVYFNHAQHVEVGKVQCQECHGPVERMNRVVDVTELSMKFCLDCHRQREIITDNEYYALYKFHLKPDKSLRDKIHMGNRPGLLKPGEKPKVKDIGGQDCSSCHY